MTARMIAAGVAFLGATLVAGAAPQDDPVLTVREVEGGGYTVSAQFSVPESRDVARDVLTDYANIPRFMPDVRASHVLERQDRYVRVEQEAVSQFMMFTKRIHLVLDVEEEDAVIRFRDRCNKSFVKYEGTWTLTPGVAGGTEVGYELAAQPAFKVPGFVLRKLLNRDASVMIERLRGEISARAIARTERP